MLLAAALVPDTALLVPGASGTTSVLDDERAAALAAVLDLVDADPERVVVVVSGAGDQPSRVDGPVLASLTAAGVDDDALGWAPTVLPPGAPGPVLVVRQVAAAAGLLLLGRAGWTGPVSVVVAPPIDAADLREAGRRLADGADRVALLLVASLSARHGPDGPLADDPRAPGFDRRSVEDLVGLGPEAGARLAAVPAELAAELAVSAWAPWQVLLGAAALPADSALGGDLRLAGAPLGATYATIVWSRIETAAAQASR